MLLSVMRSVHVCIVHSGPLRFPRQGMTFTQEAVSHGDLTCCVWGPKRRRIWICCQMDGCGIGGIVPVLGIAWYDDGCIGCIGCVLGVFHV